AVADGDAADRGETTRYEVVLNLATRAILDAIGADGSWPGFLVSGWLAGGALHRTGWVHEAARTFGLLADRVPSMSVADAGWMTLALRRVGLSTEDRLLALARRRLDETQRPDGAWAGDDSPAFDVH